MGGLVACKKIPTPSRGVFLELKYKYCAFQVEAVNELADTPGSLSEVLVRARRISRAAGTLVERVDIESYSDFSSK